MLMLTIIALAVSMDGFAAGTVYGLRRIRIPLAALLTLSVCIAATLSLAVRVGAAAAMRISPGAASVTGGLMLTGIGLFTIVEHWTTSRKQRHPEPLINDGYHRDRESRKSPLRRALFRILKIPSLIGSPAEADADLSRSLSIGEAVYLGIALSLDSFAAGIGMGVLGFSPPIVIAALSLGGGGFVFAGIRVGNAMSSWPGIVRFAWIPGLLLALLGLVRVFGVGG